MGALVESKLNKFYKDGFEIFKKSSIVSHILFVSSIHLISKQLILFALNLGFKFPFIIVSEHCCILPGARGQIKLQVSLKKSYTISLSTIQKLVLFSLQLDF